MTEYPTNSISSDTIAVGHTHLLGCSGFDCEIPVHLCCTCPPTWNGVVPPVCPVHNPAPPSVTTTGTSTTFTVTHVHDYDIRCRTCGEPGMVKVEITER